MKRSWMLMLAFAAGCPAKPSGSSPTTVPDPSPTLLPGWACYHTGSEITGGTSTCFETMAACEESRANTEEQLGGVTGDTFTSCAGTTSAFCYTSDMLGSDGTVLLADVVSCSDNADECLYGRRVEGAMDNRSDITACVDVATGTSLSTAQVWACYRGNEGSDCHASMLECTSSLERWREMSPQATYSDCEEVDGVVCFPLDLVDGDGNVISEAQPICTTSDSECELARQSYAQNPGFANVGACAAP